MFCSHCGLELANTAKFCKACGSKVDAPDVAPHNSPEIANQKAPSFSRKALKLILIGSALILVCLAIFIGLMLIDEMQYKKSQDERASKSQDIENYKSRIENDSMSQLASRLSSEPDNAAIIRERMVTVLFETPTDENFELLKQHGPRHHSYGGGRTDLILYYTTDNDHQDRQFSRQLEIIQYLAPKEKAFSIITSNKSSGEQMGLAFDEAFKRNIVSTHAKWLEGEGYAVLLDTSERAIGCIYKGQSTETLYANIISNLSVLDCPEL